MVVAAHRADEIPVRPGQTHYQRLGLPGADATHEQVCRAYQERLWALQQSKHETSRSSRAALKELLDEAFYVLTKPTLREQYDQQLLKANRDTTAAQSGEQTVLGRYEIRSTICRGTRCSIEDAFDRRLKRNVVIKRSIDVDVEPISQRAESQRQAELFAGFNSGNLVKILDYDARTGAIVLERLQSDARTLVKKNGCSVSLVRDLLEDSLRGLTSLHAAGIAHGRIQLEHLLIDDQGGIKLTLTPGMTGVETAIHPDDSVRHLAPELLNPKRFGDPGVRIDLYSLGFIALELLCGNRFAKQVNENLVGESLNEEWLQWHSSPTDHLPPIETLLPDCPRELCELLHRLTNKQQHERFEDAAECLAVLNRDITVRERVVESVEVDNGTRGSVEVFGTPPELHAEYHQPNVISWKAIVENPRLLLEREALPYLVVTGLATLLFFAVGGLLLTAPEKRMGQSALSSETVSEAEYVWPEAIIEPAESAAVPDTDRDQADSSYDDRSRKVRLHLSGGGKVLEVDRQPGDGGAIWSLEPGKHLALCETRDANQDKRYVVNVPFEVAEGEGELTVYLNVPKMPATKDSNQSSESPALASPSNLPKSDAPKLARQPIDPLAIKYADVEGAEFFPHTAVFPIVGAVSNDNAEKQRRYLIAKLDELAVEMYGVEREYLVNVKSKPIDPRASFLVALQAFLLGKPNDAIKYCRRSLADAKHFHVPFVLPLRLLTYLRVYEGHPGVAIVECRRVIDWLREESSGDAEDQFENAVQEACWCIGNLVGYLRHAASDNTRRHIDLRLHESYLNRFSTANQWKAYRVALRDTEYRHRFLLESVQAYRSLPAVSQENQAPESGSISGAATATSGLSSKSSTSRSRDFRYSDYRSCDVSSLAIETLATLPSRAFSERHVSL